MLSIAYAMGNPNQGAGQPSAMINLLPIILIFIVFYFVLIKPQQRQQEVHKKVLNELKKNDEVVTSGGMHGTIVNIKDTTVILRVDDNCRIEVQKESVAYVKKQ